ncbi:MAG: xanthine dehydrogenase accessory protein XdhC [Ramlibacter sp.]
MSNLHVHQLMLALQQGPAVLVSVHDVQGSGPREVGAWMAVLAAEVINTIGGGNLEFQAIDEARQMLGGAGTVTRRYPLGPSLGQCCGGVVQLRFEPVAPADAPALAQRLQARFTPVALFGGGHVGKALVQVLGTLPLSVTWVDSRDQIFPADVPFNVTCEHSDPVQAAVADLPSGAHVLIMSFSHAEDLDVVAACLRRLRERNDLPCIGLIGSKSKWAAFRHRLEERGFSAAELARITSPIGLPGITGKQPEVIAVSVAAQLLQALPAGKP